jgi:outer membrane protein assembly factor BamE (lipoprotein component of BamABCDE complex)
MTREEVVSLLGTPTETNYFPEHDLVYWLGSEGGYFSLDSEWWLAIKFGRNGRVSKTALVRE